MPLYGWRLNPESFYRIIFYETTGGKPMKRPLESAKSFLFHPNMVPLYIVILLVLPVAIAGLRYGLK